MTANVLVIGRKGQVATSLAQAARAAGLTLTTLGRPEVDLVNPSSIHTAIAGSAADVVVNAAAYTAVDKAESERDLAFAISKRRREEGGFPGAARILGHLADGSPRKRVGLTVDGKYISGHATITYSD